MGLLFAWWRDRQLPRYQGKTVAEWFGDYRATQKSFSLPSGAVFFTTAAGVLTINGRVQVIYNSGPAVPPKGYVFRTGTALPDEKTTQALKAMGADAAVWLGREVRRGDSVVARWYLKILPKLPPSIQKHAPLVEPRDQLRCNAAQALEAMGTGALPAVPLLLECFSDGTNSRVVRPFVARVLRSVPFEQERLDQTLRELERKDLYGAVELISELSLKTKQAAYILTNALVATNFMGRPLAVSAFYNFQEQAETAIPVLTPLFTSRDAGLVESVGAVLQRFGEKAAPALPAVLEALKSPDSGIRYEAVRVLEAMGTNALPAVPLLQKAANDESVMVRRASARTLEHLDVASVSKDE